MKADLYVQGHFWAAVDLPGDGLLALLAKGMITHAKNQSTLLKQTLKGTEDVSCTISLRLKTPISYTPETGD